METLVLGSVFSAAFGVLAWAATRQVRATDKLSDELGKLSVSLTAVATSQHAIESSISDLSDIRQRVARLEAVLS